MYQCFGVPGGYRESSLNRIVQSAKQAGVKEVFIEKNFGHGAFEAVIKPYFEREWPVTLEEDYATGQKELRIIETLEPLMAAHRLIFNAEMVKSDFESVQNYPLELRMSYSLFNQMSNITIEKNSLRHDDRLDALYGAIRQLTSQIDYDEVTRINRLRAQEMRDYIQAMNTPHLRRAMLYGDYGTERKVTNTSVAMQRRVYGQNYRSKSSNRNTISARISRTY
ncbi:large terminase subunit [Escherichia phage vB_EcolP_P433.1]|uniref:Large terminase subunit n=1 Tax=Escherichia phage vB_EcolP_P433.1 TaxID=2653657 RepID=A0AAE6P0B2_9CAUD|nr:large terminase subunit [Escherichia phage vB_EcolP_P433.1]